MKKYCSTHLITAFLLLCITGIQAQTGTQAEKLMKALKAKDLANALVTAQNIDSVNYRDNSGRSLLMCASENGYTEVCKILLNKGANLDLQASNGVTALNLASQNGHKEVVKLLLEKGAKMDLQAKIGVTALIMAAQEGYIQIVKFLLEKGANPNLKDNTGKTAYDYAKNNEIKTLLTNYMKK
jgi:ankyrin repeat protein